MFYAAVDKGYYGLAIVGIIFSVVSAFYYLKVIKIMFFENSDDQVSLDQNFELKFVLFISLFVTCFVFLFVPIIQNFILTSLL